MAVAGELQQIYGDTDELVKHARVVNHAELEENDFNLNIPRYVDTFEPAPLPDVPAALAAFELKPSDALPHPSDWGTARVGRVIEVKRGISWSKEQEQRTDRDNAVPVIRVGNVQERLVLEDLLYIRGLSAKAIEAKKVSADWCILVGSNGNKARIGNAILVTEDSDFVFASFLLAARPRTDSGINPGYFYRWLTTERVQSYLSASSEGTTGLSNLSHSFLRAMTIAYPDEAEQHAIAEILDAVDAALTATEEARDAAIDLRRQLAEELLIRGMRGERLKKTRVGHVPTSWEVVSLKDIVTSFQYGLSVAMAAQGDLPILRMGNIQSGDIDLSDLKYVRLADKIVAPYKLNRGDVLFNRTNSQEHVGKVGVYRSDEAAVFASYLIRLVLDPEQVDPYFLGHLLNSYDAQCRIKRYATPGVQQVNINASNLARVLVALPRGAIGSAEQREISAILEQAQTHERAYDEKLCAIETIKRTLSGRLLSGDLRVGRALAPATA
jgi:type I restriction enzyme S subunit